MITRVFARNYRSIGEVDLELGAMTALVGPNGSGKSNLADVLRFIGDCARGPLGWAVAQRQGFGALRHWRAAGAKVTVGVQVRTGEGEGIWAFTLGPAGQGDGFEVVSERAVWVYEEPSEPQRRAFDELLRLDHADSQGQLTGLFDVCLLRGGSVSWMTARPGLSPQDAIKQNDLFFDRSALFLAFMPDRRLEPLRQVLHQVGIYAPFPNTLRAPQSTDPSRPMNGDGHNWASTLRTLDKSSWGSELVAGLGKLVGDIDDYRVTQAGGFLIPEFRHGIDAQGRERWSGAAQESDGTLRTAAMLTALYQEPSPSLLGFEEPELAVHPGALPLLFDLLEEASTRSQILLTTHSPDLLDLLDIEDIRVIERRDGATTVAKVEERQRDLVRRRLFSTSDLLHSEGLRPEGDGGDA